MANLLPSETISENNQTLTVNNPSLLPQLAENWDAALEYYFEPVGNFSIGWFHKQITDYIVSGIHAGTIASGADNGYNGEYSGFTRLTAANAGLAIVQGWEFSYQQPFTFLPGILKGTGISANYTVIDTHGDFGTANHLSTGQVAGFIPRTGNASLSWRYRAVSGRILANYMADHIMSYSAAGSALNLYRKKRTMVSAGLAYQLRSTLSLTLDVDNVFNAPQIFYRGVPERRQRTVLNGTTISVGMSGRF